MKEKLHSARAHLENTLAFNLFRASTLMRRAFIRGLKDFDLTPEQWQVLALLYEFESITPTEISKITLQDLPSVTRMLARLEKRAGYRALFFPWMAVLTK